MVRRFDEKGACQSPIVISLALIFENYKFCDFDTVSCCSVLGLLLTGGFLKSGVGALGLIFIDCLTGCFCLNIMFASCCCTVALLAGKYSCFTYLPYSFFLVASCLIQTDFCSSCILSCCSRAFICIKTLDDARFLGYWFVSKCGDCCLRSANLGL